MSWTEGRKRAFITSVLRGGMRRFPAKYETLNAAFSATKENPKTKRQAKHYRCNICKGEFPGKDIEIDHIEPVVDPDVGFVSWDLFIERLYCKMENLQAVCKECHKEKTKNERTSRKSKRISETGIPVCSAECTDTPLPSASPSGRGRGSGRTVRKSPTKRVNNRPRRATKGVR
jgi:hypothetical protein